MWGKWLKFPAHPPYKPIRSTHEQRSETGASKRTKISCGSRSGVVRGRQGSSGVVRGRQGSSGVVRGRQESSGVVRGRQGSSGVVRGRQESSGVVSDRGCQSRQESSAKIGQLLLPSLMTLSSDSFFSLIFSLLLFFSSSLLFSPLLSSSLFFSNFSHLCFSICPYGQTSKLHLPNIEVVACHGYICNLPYKNTIGRTI